MHVPDAALVGLIGACEADPEIEVLQLTREEEGVGILSGAYLGGKRGALLMQSSGLGNAVNALGGLPMAYRIPFLILITPRGRLSEFNPSQVPAGRAVPKMLDALGIETATLERVDEVAHAGGPGDLQRLLDQPARRADRLDAADRREACVASKPCRCSRERLGRRPRRLQPRHALLPRPRGRRPPAQLLPVGRDGHGLLDRAGAGDGAAGPARRGGGRRRRGA